MNSLPFHLPVTDKLRLALPRRDQIGVFDKVEWLAKHHGVTVIPSMANLLHKGRVARAGNARRDFIGFGNPLLDGQGELGARLANLARNFKNCQAVEQTKKIELASLSRGVAVLDQTGGLVNMSILKIQSPLPETALELCAVEVHIEVGLVVKPSMETSL